MLLRVQVNDAYDLKNRCHRAYTSHPTNCSKSRQGPEDGVEALSSSGPCQTPFLQLLFKNLPAGRCELPLRGR